MSYVAKWQMTRRKRVGRAVEQFFMRHNGTTAQCLAVACCWTYVDALQFPVPLNCRIYRIDDIRQVPEVAGIKHDAWSCSRYKAVLLDLDSLFHFLFMYFLFIHLI